MFAFTTSTVFVLKSFPDMFAPVVLSLVIHVLPLQR